MHEMHNFAYQMSINFLHCSSLMQLRSPTSLRHLRWGNASSYKLEVVNGVPLRPIAI